MSCVREFITEDVGQDLIEYALLTALMAVACILAIENAGLVAFLTDAASRLQEAQ